MPKFRGNRRPRGRSSPDLKRGGCPMPGQPGRRSGSGWRGDLQSPRHLRMCAPTVARVCSRVAGLTHLNKGKRESGTQEKAESRRGVFPNFREYATDACHPERSEEPHKLPQAPHYRASHTLGWFERLLAALGMTCVQGICLILGFFMSS